MKKLESWLSEENVSVMMKEVQDIVTRIKLNSLLNSFSLGHHWEMRYYDVHRTPQLAIYSQPRRHPRTPLFWFLAIFADAQMGSLLWLEYGIKI